MNPYKKFNYKSWKNNPWLPKPPALTKVLVWFVDGPLAGENILVTRGVLHWSHHVRDADVSVCYIVVWDKPVPMAFYFGNTTGWEG